MKPSSATIKTILAQTHRQTSEIQKRIAMDSLYTFSKKQDFTSFQSVYGCLSVHRHSVSSLRSQLLSFPTVFADFQAAHDHDSIGDIIFSRSCVPHLLRILLCSLGTHFFPTAQLHIGIPISGLISIFIKCTMCWVFAQGVPIT